MKAALVRKSFLDYFGKNGHEKVASSSLLPANDPTLLFNNAGMNQFKDLFTGRETRPYKRATTSQKCVRAGGKHNDLDEVGKTSRHHTFFEMLGNFSFGDYFKPEAIQWAWQLLTNEWGIDPKRLVVTVFAGDKSLGVSPDEEARKLWRDTTGFADNKIIGLGMSENFWMMGDTGPMGPCSEIHYYLPGVPDGPPAADAAHPSWNGWLEIWNLVFMQYERKVAGGPLDKLPAPSIDTGAGLERVASVLQGKSSNYDTDLFMPLLLRAADLAGKKYGQDPDMDMSMRVLADHARAASFLIADGIFPDKTGREYVLRRIFRRAVRHGKRLGIEEPFMFHMCQSVVELMRDAYPELSQRASLIADITLEEEKRFRATLDRGLDLLEDEFSTLAKTKKSVLPGEKVFLLYDTYGFPVDLTEIIAGERGLSIDRPGFETEMEKARERSKFHSDDETVADVYKQLCNEAGETTFHGYDDLSGTGKVVALAVGAQIAGEAPTGSTIAFACDQTPFYGEQGGQIGDAGSATFAGGGEITISSAIKPSPDTIIMLGQVTRGTLKKGDTLTFTVDGERRARIRANHSATHLLNLALRTVLGDHVAQKGSLVAPDKLRFDFSHSKPMTDEQLAKVEELVNAEIRRNNDSQTDVLALDEAKKRGAVAMFGEKYGEKVRVVRIGADSLEFCGGTHVRRAGDIGFFKIVSETGIAQGVRRIEAVSGEGAFQYVQALHRQLSRLGSELKVSPLEVFDRVEKMSQDMRAQEKQISALKSKLAAGGTDDLLKQTRDIAGVRVLVTKTDVDDAKALRETGDHLRQKMGSGVIVLAGVGADKVSLLAMVSSDLTQRFHAGKLLQCAAEVMGGKGGGKPDVAQGGGKEVGKVGDALAKVMESITAQA